MWSRGNGIKDKATYRGLRGLVRYAKFAQSYNPRALITWNVVNGPAGFCKWCGQECDEPKRKRWHSHCTQWAVTATGGYPYQLLYKKPHECSVCGKQTWSIHPRFYGGKDTAEYDHTLAISVARELGGRFVLRAFTPHNIRRLCHDCHAAKTGADRALLSMLRKAKAMPSGPEAKAIQGALSL